MKTKSTYLRTGVLLLALCLFAGVLPGYGIRPEDGRSALNARQDHQNSPFKRGLRNLRKIVKSDLLEEGESLPGGKIKLKSGSGALIVNRLNRRLSHHNSHVEIVRVQTDKLGHRHVRLRQYFRKIPIIGSEMVVHVNPANEIYAVTGNIGGTFDLSVSARIAANDAAAAAAKALQLNSPSGEPRLVIFDNRLAYEVMVPDESPQSPALWKCYVDTETGETLFRENQVVHAAPVGGVAANVTGSRLPDEDGTNVTISGWHDDIGQYFLRNNTNLWGVFNEDAADWEQKNTSAWGTSDPAAVSLAGNMETVQNYVSTVLGWSSFNDAGAFATANVHVGVDYVNAYWNGSQLYFGDGDGITANALTTLDITAHEFGHAITDYSSDLIYSYESGALNESYSDILGTLVEFYGQPDGRSSYPSGTDGYADWLCGEDAWLGGEALRDLRAPARFSQPSYYQGSYWYIGSGDNGGVHTNSGVQNFAFFLLAEGGVGSNDGHPYSITGLGIEAAGEIAMYANMYLLTSSSQYQDSRDAWILAAATLGHDVSAVSDVWAACGIVPLVKNLDVSPTALNFGDVGAGLPAVMALTLSNSGGEATIVSALDFDNGLFTSQASVPFIVPAAGSININVIFSPVSIASASGILSITSDAADHPALSVALSGNGVAPAGISLTPLSFSASVGVGGAVTELLSIENTGAAPLEYSVTAVEEFIAPVRPADIYSSEHFLPVAKNVMDSRIGLPVLNGSGGPDVFGYSWKDSDEGSGPSYVWNDISATGSVLGTISACDDCFQQQAISFVFPFYGNDFSSIYVSSNGYITLGAGSSALGNYPLPSVNAPANLIAGFFDDLNPGSAGTVYFQDFGTHAVVQFSAVSHYGGGGTYTFQIVLNENGRIQYYYHTLIGTLNSCTAGIQNAARDDGLTVVYNAAYLKNALAVELKAGPGWLSTVPETGTVNSGETAQINVSLDASSLLGGTYHGTLQVSHNDPLTANPIIVPVSLYVDGIRRLDISPAVHDFGNVWAGAAGSVSIVLTNGGDEATNLASISSGNAVFAHDLTLPATIPPFGSISFNVSFHPAAVGAVSGILSFNSDAEDNPILSLNVTGTGTTPPFAVLAPADFTVNMNPGDAPADLTSILSNTGGDNLSWQVTSVMETSSPAVVQTTVSPLAAPALDKIYDQRNYEFGYAPGQVIVALKAGAQTLPSLLFSMADVGSVQELAIAVNPKTRMAVPGTRKLFLLHLDLNDPGAVEAAIRQFRSLPEVAYAEPNYIRKLVNIPDDASFGSLYGMHNIGQSGGTVDADIDAVEAWDRHTGSRSITLGLIDTGIDYLHPDLAANIWTNAAELSGIAGVDDDGNGYIDDIHGYDFINNDSDPWDDHYHGTHCAGTIAGVGNNGIGVAGVNWIASVAALKIFNSGGSTTDAAILNAVDYSNAMGMKITSNSWGGGPYSQSLYDLIAAGEGLGHLFIAAAGNSNSNNDAGSYYPSGYNLDNIIAVAATDRNDLKASFSSYGATTVDLAAPGVETYSCQPGGGYQNLSGTSMATPHVSGAALLVWTLNPSLSASEVKNALLNTVDVIPSMTGIVLTNGRLNVNNALEEAGPAWLSAAPLTPGTLAPGASQDIISTVSPAGLLAGSYTGLVAVSTNDPANPQFLITVTANISGFRSLALSPASIDFGNVWNGGSAARSVTFSNVSNEAAVISSVTSDNPVFSLTAALPLTVPAFGEVTAEVSFNPDRVASETGIITINSNAEDHPVLTVSLSGNGTAAPEISIVPGSLNAALQTGESMTAAVTVSNPGGDDLVFSVSPEYLTAPAAVFQSPLSKALYEEMVRLQAEYPSQSTLDTAKGDFILATPLPAPADGEQVLLIRDALPWGKDVTVPLLASLGTVVTIITSSQIAATDFGPFGMIVTSSDQTAAYYANIASSMAKFESYVSSGGMLHFHAIAQSSVPTINLPGGVISTYGASSVNYIADSTHPVVENVISPINGSSANHHYLSNLPAGAVVIIQDPSNRPTFAEYRIGSGTVLATGMTLEFYYPSGLAEFLFPNALTYLLNGAMARGSWLSADQTTGSVPAGSSVEIQITMDASGLIGGEYTASLNFDHNAPSAPNPLSIPVSLSVDGVRRISVSPSSLDFGDVWAGQGTILQLTLENTGSEATEITSIGLVHSEFSHDLPLPLTLLPGSSHTFNAVFSPADAGMENAILSINSNAEDHPVLTVTLAGEGILPPRIDVSPAEFSVSLLSGASTSRELSISNTGGAALDFSIQSAPQSAWPGVVDILIYTRGADMVGEYLNVVNSLSAHAPAHTITSSVTLDPAVLESELAGKEVFLIMEQETLPIPSGQGAIFAAALDNFLQGGGTIIYHNPGWGGNPVSFLSEAGLMNLTYAGNSSSGAVTLEQPAHPIFAGLTGPLNMTNATAYCSVNDDADVLASYLGNMVIAEKVIHSGRVITLGPDYYTYDDNWARVISNAVSLGPVSAPWINFDVISGNVLPGASFTVNVGFDAAGLSAGDYFMNINITHNDPGTVSPLQVPVILTITETGGVHVSRILSIGPAAQTVSGGTYYNLWNITVGGAARGAAEGSRYKLLLK